MERKDKVWLHYVKNIIAADVSSGVFLASYLRHLESSWDYAAYFEVIDLQKYKKITTPGKIRQAMREDAKMPFVFIAGKN